ncbi:L-serine ammonia-lyase [Psychromonas sp. RZ22]|uniref:L-serine ammonia-lyase n=1 Tax=Psychromonas algarum TaxID=2555643 RepID=UPI001068A2B7|nr:L-serine ammonia-lyase [Psychromonas sp. RZ22]TEW56497.1 L-serine ammonia-lyase [Psychromonas sp. RZ22]
MLSIFDIYKIGIGPSSSHTSGPMLAAYLFANDNQIFISKITHIKIQLFGSLSLTGKGHHTDRAIMLGLMGFKPDTVKSNAANKLLSAISENKKLPFLNQHNIKFDPASDIVFCQTSLPLHENGLRLTAYQEDKLLNTQTYYSTGGGFISTEDQLLNPIKTANNKVPFPFNSAESLLNQADKNGLSIGGLALKNELSFCSEQQLNEMTTKIWDVMNRCLERGLKTEGILEGGLHVIRRAPALLKTLQANEGIENDPMSILDWVNLYAFAVSEENAAGGQVVTSPTNGAAGVIPSVLMYYNKYIREIDNKQLKDFLAVSAAIGMLYKMNASISGAEVGCQGEIGVSSSMAAAGLTAIRGGSNEQICIAAEIAMEHSLGMTCDPIGGLVQIPCIERNAMGAMKAINASRMALKRNSKSLISLDKVIATMYQTGKDMNKKYRETSQGGLAIIHLAPPCE